MTNFAKNFRIIRNNKQISQQEIANAIGRTAPAVTRWEEGLSEPNATDLMAIADYLNVPIDLLLRDELEQTQVIYDNKTIKEITDNLTKIIELLKSPTNANIFSFSDSGKQRVPKIQFRQNNQQSNSINIQSNGEIKIEKSFNSNNRKK